MCLQALCSLAAKGPQPCTLQVAQPRGRHSLGAGAQAWGRHHRFTCHNLPQHAAISTLRRCRHCAPSAPPTLHPACATTTATHLRDVRGSWLLAWRVGTDVGWQDAEVVLALGLRRQQARGRCRGGSGRLMTKAGLARTADPESWSTKSRSCTGCTRLRGLGGSSVGRVAGTERWKQAWGQGREGQGRASQDVGWGIAYKLSAC